jgi:protein phosphatase
MRISPIPFLIVGVILLALSGAWWWMIDHPEFSGQGRQTGAWYEPLRQWPVSGILVTLGALMLGLAGAFAAIFPLRTAPRTLSLRVGAVSARGNHRANNEDNFHVPGRRPVQSDLAEASSDLPALALPSSNVFIVADGMGGQQAGEKASLMAVELIPRAIASRLGPDEEDPRPIQEAIRQALAEVNAQILESSGLFTEYSNMGTTVVLTLFRHDRVYVTGIGDSPAYLLRDNHLERLTKEHSLAMALLEAGAITKEEFATHKFRNVLYLYLGSKDAQSGPEDIRALELRPGDRFLLATDGLTGVVADDRLIEVLGKIHDPQEAAARLKDLALEADSKDNVTCLVIHVLGGEARAAPTR